MSPTIVANQYFDPVVPGRQFSFPQDHNLHERFQSEWWYVTANLEGEDGQSYGAQFTLFSNTMLVANQPQRIFFAHAALSSETDFFHTQRYSKANMGHAGITQQPWTAFFDHWQLKGSNDGPLPGVLTVNEPDFGFKLALGDSPYLLQGNQGFSKKNSSGSNASYYYSAPFIKLSGNIRVNDKSINVNGEAWLDREWSSGIFNGKNFNLTQAKQLTNKIGWDWLSLHLDEQTALMLYRVKNQGETYLTGVIMHSSGKQQTLTDKQISWLPIRHQSFNGRQYPIQWQLSVPSQQINLTIKPINDNQFMDGPIPYWEGAVKTSGSHHGQGYLELF
jgi:predicted secreted hydrolase